MFERIIDAALKNRGAVLVLTAVAALWGWSSFRELTIEAFPDPTDTQVNVITLLPGQPSEEVERQIGLPIERALNGLPGLTRLRNLSMFGLSFITLTYDDGTDVLIARQQVLERLRNADLPDGVVPELGPLATPVGEIYRYTLSGGRDDPMLLRTLQDWVVAPMLMQVDGVADVVSFGGLVREIHVLPDPSELAARNLTLLDLEKALEEGSINASGGILDRGAEQIVVRSEGIFTTHDDVRRVRIATREGVPVFVGDVATVTDGWTPRQGIVSRGSDLDVVEGIVLMRRGENPSSVLERVRDTITRIDQRLAPEGVSIDPFYDRTELVDTTLRTVGINLAEGALLVILVLFAFLLDIRAALIVATLIPLSLLGAFAYLHARGMSANLLSMGAVDFGIIVDGGVVIIESILARLGARQVVPDSDSMVDRIRAACLAVLRPTVFALLIIIAAYLPIFMLERVEGRTFAPLAHTVVAALAAALIFSITLVPVLATFAYRRPIKHRESPVVRLAMRAYRPTLLVALRRPLMVFALAGVLLGITGHLGSRLGSEFLPELNEGGLYLTFSLPPNVSRTEARKMVPELTALIEQSPVVDALLSQLGRTEEGTDPALSNNLEFFVKLHSPSDWPAHLRSVSDVIDDLQARIDRVPGLEVNFSMPIKDRVNESISGQFGQIAVKLYGDDLTELQAQADRVKKVIAQVDGVADLGLVMSNEVPQLRVRPNRESLARHGLDMADFQHAFQAALGGHVVGELREGERRFDVVLRLPGGARDDVDKIRALRIPTDDGITVPLETLAEVGTGLGRASINRENGRRYIGIRMNVRGRDLGTFVAEAQSRVLAEAPLPTGMAIEWGGEFESKERAMNRLLAILPLTLLVTFVLLVKAFNSFSLAGLTLASVPFALTGGVVALWFADMPLSVAAAVGFIALIGQASLNGVLVLSAVDERRRAGEPLEQAIVEGALERLRPVLMTALLAALGLVPAALSRGIGSETQRPIAVVIVAGTLSACALTLVLLPVAYGLMEKVKARFATKAKPVKEPALDIAAT